MNYQIDAPGSAIRTTVKLPASKSISNRALILNALSYSAYDVENLSDCDDTNLMVKALNSNDRDFNVGAAGTTMRFLTAFLSKVVGEWTITGTERMKNRPIKVLVDALNALGARIEYMEKEGYPPLRIFGSALQGGEISLPGNVSSQYISAILMIAPLTENGVTLHLEGAIISRPYIHITLQLMEQYGVAPLLEFSGSLDPEWQADVAAKVDGRVERVYVNEGDRVTKGQVLAELEQRDTDAALREARGNYMDAQTNLRKAERDLERYSALYKQGAVSEQVADDYAFARDNAAAKLDAARGTVQAMESQFEGTVITAPADGIISKRYHQEGYYAAAGTPLFAIADISVLKTVINIPEGNISGVSVGNEAEIDRKSVV